jgi:hypothetical protein
VHRTKKNFKAFAETIKNYGDFLLLFKNISTLISSVAKITGSNWNPVNLFAAWVTGLPSELSIGSFAVGFISPIIVAADVVHDHTNIKQLGKEDQRKKFLRVLLFLSSPKNAEQLNSYPEITAWKAKPENASILPQPRMQINDQKVQQYQEQVEAFLKTATKEVRKDFYTTAESALSHTNIKQLFENTDANEDRTKFQNKYFKQQISTYRNLGICVIAWATLAFDVLKFSLELSPLAETIAPYIAIGSLAFSWIGVITTIIFTTMKLGLILKNYSDAIKESKTKVDHPLNFIDKIKLFITQGFLLDAFSILCTSGTIVGSLLLLAGIASAPVNGIIIASLSSSYILAKATDWGIRKFTEQHAKEAIELEEILAPKTPEQFPLSRPQLAPQSSIISEKNPPEKKLPLESVTAVSTRNNG